jgi:hypothetical protein
LPDRALAGGLVALIWSLAPGTHPKHRPSRGNANPHRARQSARQSTRQNVSGEV